MVRTVRYLLLILLLTSCEKIDLAILETPGESTTSLGASTGTIPSWLSDADGNLLTAPVPDGFPSGPSATVPGVSTSGSTILKAGTTVKYHLRLVSPVILRPTSTLGRPHA